MIVLCGPSPFPLGIPGFFRPPAAQIIEVNGPLFAVGMAEVLGVWCPTLFVLIARPGQPTGQEHARKPVAKKSSRSVPSYMRPTRSSLAHKGAEEKAEELKMYVLSMCATFTVIHQHWVAKSVFHLLGCEYSHHSTCLLCMQGCGINCVWNCFTLCNMSAE